MTLGDAGRLGYDSQHITTAFWPCRTIRKLLTEYAVITMIYHRSQEGSLSVDRKWKTDPATNMVPLSH
jgi:hypothetical protein